MERFHRVLEEMYSVDMPVLLLLKPMNIFYITGFKPSSFSILLIKEEPLLWVSKMEFREAEKTSKIPFQEFKSFKEFKNALKHQNLMKLGIEESLPIGIYNKIKNDFEIEIIDIIDKFRMIKTSDELKSLNKAIKIAEKSFKELEFKGNEWELAANLEYLMRFNGSQREAFETIIATGPRSSLPHAQPTNNPLEYPLLIDWGAVWGNYCSDCTRTIVNNHKQEEILNIVLEAQTQAIKAIKPGIKASDIDHVVRGVIEDYGYLDEFLHSTGHGIGLEVHEKPSISAQEEIILEKNMVITIEPGIYLKDQWGVRLEDMVLVRKNAKKISHLPYWVDVG